MPGQTEAVKDAAKEATKTEDKNASVFRCSLKRIKMKKFFFILSILFCARLINSAEIPETTTLLPNEEEESEPSLKGYRLVEATPLTADDLEFLRTLDETVPEDVLDFWSTPVKIEEAVPILVHPELLPHVEEAFQSKNLSYNIRINDFSKSIQEEQKQIEAESGAGLQNRDPSNRLTFDLFTYHKLEEIDSYLAAIQSSAADLAVDFSMRSVGTTHEGRPIKLVSISSKDKSKKRAAVFLDCGIHAREWVSPAFCLYIIDRLLDISESGMTEKFDFYLMPTTNPDGYVYTWGKNRMWRKNRRPSDAFLKLRFKRQAWNPYPQGFPALGGAQYPTFGGQTQNTKCIGADPNRNFDILHARVGSSNDPCQDTFHGEAAFSEQESKAVRDAINGLVAQYGQDRVAAYLSVHAYSQFWMTPHGHIKDRPKDYKDHQRVAGAAVSALSRRFGTSYQYGPINEVIYQASGSSVDWAYANAGVKYSFALELRDQGQSGFMLPISQVQPTLQETWDGLKAMTDAITKEYPPQ